MSTRREFLKGIGSAATLGSLGSIVLPILTSSTLVSSCAPTSMPLSATSTELQPSADGTFAVDVSDLSASNPAKAILNLHGPDGKPVLITRVSEANYKALSMNCTHQQCQVESRATNNEIPCNCHGSRFALDGSVVVGPAVVPLRSYTAIYDASSEKLHISFKV